MPEVFNKSQWKRLKTWILQYLELSISGIAN